MARNTTLRQIFAGTFGTLTRKVWVGLKGLIIGSDGSEAPRASLHTVQGGTPHTPSFEPGLLVQNDSSAGSAVSIMLHSGTTGNSQIAFGSDTDDDAGLIIYRPSQDDLRFRTSNTNRLTIHSNGDHSIKTASAFGDLTVGGGGILAIKEGVEPGANSGFGKIWPVADGTLWFQDPAQGDPHLIVGPAYQILRFHGIADHTLTIATQAQMIKFDGTNAVGLGDEFGHITGSTSTDELTVGSADGIYDLGWFASLSAQGGASREVILNLGVELATAIAVTGATGSGTSPIVLTIAGLLGSDGLLIEIVGVGGNTAANGSWIINASTSTTIELYSLNRVASTGNGTYTADTGELNIYYPSFNLAHTEISQNDLLLNGGGSTGGGVHLNEGDKVALYASNLDGDQALDFAQAVFGIRRISGPRSGVVPLVF